VLEVVRNRDKCTEVVQRGRRESNESSEKRNGKDGKNNEDYSAYNLRHFHMGDNI
jgi:hypothetical protein